jgi:hypothetical protein
MVVAAGGGGGGGESAMAVRTEEWRIGELLGTEPWQNLKI